MIQTDLPEDLRDMPRGLLIRVLGVDMNERPGSNADLAAAAASLCAQVDAERATS